MYNYEIRNYLQERSYNLNQKEYQYIVDTCPQINHIKYEPYDDIFKVWTVDGEYFEFKVHYNKDIVWH